jgi:DNA-binding NarL/FixJ family response regulator
MDRLTESGHEVLVFVAHGLTNDEIGERVFPSR